MSNIVAIASGDLALELALAGVRVEERSSLTDVETALDGYLQDPGQVTVVIVESRFRQDFSEWFRERLRRHKGRPLVVYCPEFAVDELDVNAYLASVLKPALGYEIRLE
jgi:vacuolar-type H+-ATPase subunit F/Vma7